MSKDSSNSVKNEYKLKTYNLFSLKIIYMFVDYVWTVFIPNLLSP